MELAWGLLASEFLASQCPRVARFASDPALFTCRSDCVNCVTSVSITIWNLTRSNLLILNRFATYCVNCVKCVSLFFLYYLLHY